MDQEQDIEMGREYRDRATGFTGTATGVAHYLYETSTVRIESVVDGRRQVEWFDVTRIEPV